MASKNTIMDYDEAYDKLPKEEIERNLAEYKKAANENCEIINNGKKLSAAYCAKDRDPEMYKNAMQEYVSNEVGLVKEQYQAITMLWGRGPDDARVIAIASAQVAQAGARLKKQEFQIKLFERMLKHRERQELAAMKKQEELIAKRASNYLNQLCLTPEEELIAKRASKYLNKLRTTRWDYLEQAGYEYIDTKPPIPLLIHPEKKMMVLKKGNQEFFLCDRLAERILSFLGSEPNIIEYVD